MTWKMVGTIKESVSWMKTNFSFGKRQAHGRHRRRAELESANAANASLSNPPPARIISSIASHHSLTHSDTLLVAIQRPEQAHLKDSGDISAPKWSSQASKESLNECCATRAKAIKPKRKMGLSKTKRILVLLAIDSAFFLLELVVGMQLKFKC